MVADRVLWEAEDGFIHRRCARMCLCAVGLQHLSVSGCQKVGMLYLEKERIERGYK